jgi:hypothetical protein
MITLKKDYHSNISQLIAGTEIVGIPITIHSITVAREADTDAVISFSDSITSYSSTTRFLKVVLSPEQRTHTVNYPNGLPLTYGLCATANSAGVDVSITYE